MEYIEEDIKLMKRYFDLTLSDKELAEVEKRMETDHIFAQKIEEYRESIVLVDTVYKTSIEKKRNAQWLASIENKSVGNKNKVTLKWVASIAASILLLVAGWQFFGKSNDPNLSLLAQKSWDRNVGLGYYTLRNDSKDVNQEAISNAYNAYKDKKYELSIELTERFDQSNDYYEDALLIRALSHHKIGEAKTALELLNTLSKDPSRKITKIANWYKGLIYLDLKKITEAKKYLELPLDTNSEIKIKE